jgi:TatA/E family protein of Tat protein translocase
MPFGHSWIVVLVILFSGLVLLGPGKLGQLGAALGRSIHDFRKTSRQDDTKP